MKRNALILAAGALALASAGCGGDPPGAAQPANQLPNLSIPNDTAVVDVSVTKPANPAPVKPEELPAQAQAVAQVQQLTPDEQVCATYAVKQTLDGDPSIAQVNGKVASVIGNSIVACTNPDRLGQIMAEAFAQGGPPLPADQANCLKSAVSADPHLAAQFFSVVLTTDPMAMMNAIKPFSDRCQISIIR